MHRRSILARQPFVKVVCRRNLVTICISGPQSFIIYALHIASLIWVWKWVCGCKGVTMTRSHFQACHFFEKQLCLAESRSWFAKPGGTRPFDVLVMWHLILWRIPKKTRTENRTQPLGEGLWKGVPFAFTHFTRISRMSHRNLSG